MDQRPGRRDKGNKRATCLTSLLIATLIILAPNEKPRVINRSQVGEARPRGGQTDYFIKWIYFLRTQVESRISERRESVRILYMMSRRKKIVSMDFKVIL
jgi:hypothetical protein